MAQKRRTSTHNVVVFSPEALDDLLEIYDDTAEQWGDRQADKYINFLLDAAQLLADSPSIAPVVPNFAPVRCYLARWKNARQGHRIFFVETDEGISVVRVLHSRRNWQQHL